MMECNITGAWGGWIEASGQRTALGAGDPAAFDPLPEPLSAEAFPRRWNPRRAIPREIEPLAAAAARALERGGWWRHGSGEGLPGALVVSADGGPLGAAIEFARELAGAPRGAVSPTGFLFSLPSTAASVLGLLFGLPDYQTTLAQGALSGIRALGHALDLLSLGRIERVLVAALSIAEGEQARTLPGSAGATARLAAALCLESAGAGPAVAIEVGGGGVSPAGPPEADRLPPGLPAVFGHFAAAPLVRILSWLEEARQTDVAETTIAHEDPRLARWAWIKLQKRNKASWQQMTR